MYKLAQSCKVRSGLDFMSLGYTLHILLSAFWVTIASAHCSFYFALCSLRIPCLFLFSSCYCHSGCFISRNLDPRLSRLECILLVTCLTNLSLTLLGTLDPVSSQFLLLSLANSSWFLSLVSPGYLASVPLPCLPFQLHP